MFEGFGKKADEEYDAIELKHIQSQEQQENHKIQELDSDSDSDDQSDDR